jgi:hypothetical protein
VKYDAMRGKCYTCGADLNKQPGAFMASVNRPELRYYGKCPACHAVQPWAEQ